MLAPRSLLSEKGVPRARFLACKRLTLCAKQTSISRLQCTPSGRNVPYMAKPTNAPESLVSFLAL